MMDISEMYMHGPSITQTNHSLRSSQDSNFADLQLFKDIQKQGYYSDKDLKCWYINDVYIYKWE